MPAVRPMGAPAGGSLLVTPSEGAYDRVEGSHTVPCGSMRSLRSARKLASVGMTGGVRRLASVGKTGGGRRSGDQLKYSLAQSSSNMPMYFCHCGRESSQFFW